MQAGIRRRLRTHSPWQAPRMAYDRGPCGASANKPESGHHDEQDHRRRACRWRMPDTPKRRRIGLGRRTRWVSHSSSSATGYGGCRSGRGHTAVATGGPGGPAGHARRHEPDDLCGCPCRGRPADQPHRLDARERSGSARVRSDADHECCAGCAAAHGLLRLGRPARIGRPERPGRGGIADGAAG